MTEPRITSFLLAIKAGADTPKLIARRHMVSPVTVKRWAQQATALGYVETDTDGFYRLTSAGWTQIAHTIGAGQ